MHIIYILYILNIGINKKSNRSLLLDLSFYYFINIIICLFMN